MALRQILALCTVRVRLIADWDRQEHLANYDFLLPHIQVAQFRRSHHG